MSSAAWPDERVDVLKRLWEAGLSASQIAREICLAPFQNLPHVSRNAVIGVIHRRGFGGRIKTPSSGAPRRVRQPKAYAAAPGHNAKPVPPRSRGNTALAAAFDVEELPEVSAFDNVIPMTQRVSLLELTDATCRWPIGDPQEESFAFCGARPLTELPYCAHHCRVAYISPEDRRRARARR